MGNVSDTIVEKIKHIFSPIIFFPAKGAVYVIMWKNIVHSERPQTKIQNN
jgi:hypothetical protein